MQFLVGIIDTVVGFSAVMLASSLLVMVTIRVLHYLANRRATGLTTLLASVHLKYREKVEPASRAGDVQQDVFVSDVLTHPLLFGGAAGASTPSLIGTQEAAERVDSITEAELILVIESFANGGLLPERWFFAPTTAGRSLYKYKLHVETWFKTAAARSRQEFAREAKQLSWLLSALVVAAVNLDAFELALAVHRSATGRSALMDATPGLLEMADRLAPPAEADGFEADRDALIEDLGSDLGQLNSLFNIPELELGWTHSRIVRSIQAYRAGSHQPAPSAKTALELVPQRGGIWPALSDPGEPSAYGVPPREPIGTFALFFEFGRWLVSIGASVFLVAQGPPFWADLIRSILTRTSQRVPRKE
jgi:hypothetical protein